MKKLKPSQKEHNAFRQKEKQQSTVEKMKLSQNKWDEIIQELRESKIVVNNPLDKAVVRIVHPEGRSSVVNYKGSVIYVPKYVAYSVVPLKDWH